MEASMSDDVQPDVIVGPAPESDSPPFMGEGDGPDPEWRAAFIKNWLEYAERRDAEAHEAMRDAEVEKVIADMDPGDGPADP
jgi:hypothetical protein